MSRMCVCVCVKVMRKASIAKGNAKQDEAKKKLLYVFPDPYYYWTSSKMISPCRIILKKSIEEIYRIFT